MNNIKFRKWLNSDAEKLSSIGDNINIFNNMSDGYPYPYTIEKALAYITNV